MNTPGKNITQVAQSGKHLPRSLYLLYYSYEVFPHEFLASWEDEAVNE